MTRSIASSDAEPGARRRRPAPESATVTALLAGLLAITPLSVDITLPALPSLTDAFATDVAHGQLVVSLFLLGFASGQLAYGPLSDRFGRRHVLLGGLGLYVMAGAACAFAPSMGWLAAGRLLQGLGACAGPVIARAVVRDVHPGVRGARVLSVIAMGMSLAPMAAPIVGGLVMLRFDWRGVFVVLVGAGVTLLVGVHALLAETNVYRGPSAAGVHPGLAYGRLLADRAFVGYVATLACGSVGLFAFISTSPFVLMGLFGLAPYLYGLSFAAVNIGQLSGAFLSSRLTVTHGIDRTISIGLAFYLAGGLTMAVLLAAGVRHVAAVVGPMALFMLGNGMVMPNTIAGAIVPFPKSAGAASALAGFVQMVTGSLTGVALGRLYDGSARPMALAIAGSSVAAAVTFRLLVRRGQWRR
jgi:DHA1 family bicyclomycin/chloramphenicol resistance-like MFS transporter